MASDPPSEEQQLSAEDKLENEVAIEIANQFERVLDGMRTYSPGHQTLRTYYQGLFDKLQAQLKEETEYSLKVTPMGFATGTAMVNKAAKLSDSITHPLYLDGVQVFTAEQGMTLEELTRLMDIWRATLDGKLGDTHTFATRFWEADFQGFSVLSVETFTEQGPQAADAKRPVNTLQAVMQELSGIAPPSHVSPVAGTPALGRGPKMIRVTRQDLMTMKAQGVAEMTEEDLKRHEATQRISIPGLRPGDGAALCNEMRGKHALQIERALDAVFASSLRANSAEQTKLRDAFQLVLTALMGANQIERLRKNLLRQVEHAKAGNPQYLDARYAVLQRMMAVLSAPQILEPTLMALDDETKRESALAILKFVPGDAASQLLGWLTAPDTPGAVRALADLIASMKVDAVDIAPRITWSDEALALEYLHISEKLGAAGWPVRKACFTHTSKVVQQAALKGIDRETLAAHRLDLLPLLISPVPELRKEVFAPLMSTRDKAIAPAVASMLRKVQMDQTEHKKVLLALGTLGGNEACAALRQELQNSKDTDMQCAAAHALGVAGDQTARTLLEGFAGKILGGGPVKQAAKDALKRLDALKASKPA